MRYCDNYKDNTVVRYTLDGKDYIAFVDTTKRTISIDEVVSPM